MTKMFYILFLGSLSLVVNGSSIASELNEYIATIEVTPNKQNGKPWDFSGGAPDILLVVQDLSLNTSVCQNKYKCDIPFISRENEWYLEVYDKDISNNDLIGKGICKSEEICQLDSAKVQIKKKSS